MRDVYAEITNTIVTGLKTASGDFKLPWHKPGLSLPEYATTKRPYHGINVLALWLAASTRGYKTNKWASYKQWQTIGGHVRKGERGCQIIFYKQYSIDEDAGYDIEGHDDGDDSQDSHPVLDPQALASRTEINTFRANMGLDIIQPEPEDLFNSLINGGIGVNLANEMRLRHTQTHGTSRVEIMGETRENISALKHMDASLRFTIIKPKCLFQTFL